MGRLAPLFVLAIAISAAAFLPEQHKAQLERHAKPYLSWSKDRLALADAKLRQGLERLEGWANSQGLTKYLPEALVRKLGHEQAACKLSGKVAGCRCDYASVERLNRDHLHPLLSTLVKQPYFRYFKVNLYCDCQFWPDAGLCFQRDCCVQECERHEIPDAWHKEDEEAAARKKATCEGTSSVDRSVDSGVRDALSHVKGWHGLNNPWVPEDDQGLDFIYVDLQRNPEKYTGYKGEDARRIWAAIYDQSALKEAAEAVTNGNGSSGSGGSGVAREQEVLFRLISGMHSSITTSIVQNYFDETTGTWGPNMKFFEFRFATPAAKPYLENLYFSWLFVNRAVTKARDTLLAMDYRTGQPEEDAKTAKLVAELVNSQPLQAACPEPFNEGLLWRHDPEHSAQLAKQLQAAFHNITRLMDCVGCEKCKMHGKLNILGIATALKVLFSQQPTQQEAAIAAAGGEVLMSQQGELRLDRNEAIALINLLAKLSESVETVRSLSIELARQKEAAAASKAGGSTAAA